MVGDEHVELICDPGILMGAAIGSRAVLPRPVGVRQLVSSTAGDTARRLLLMGYGSKRSSSMKISQFVFLARVLVYHIFVCSTALHWR